MRLDSASGQAVVSPEVREVVMRVLVVGSGGREHALVWALSKSPVVDEIWCAPGNGGTAIHARSAGLGAGDLERLAEFAAERGVDLTIVGPEGPLVEGIRDLFDARGLSVVGPSRRAVALEGSKAFAKEFMARHGIPTAAFRIFDDADRAKGWVRSRGPVVVKADGLAAGKGVIVCSTPEEAAGAIDRVMVEKAFGSAGDRVVIEERLEGPEASVLALVSGETVLPLLPAMDFKRAFDGDRGPNTGGMGSIAPHPLVDGGLVAEVERTILRPTCLGLASEGSPYEGVLYAGLMLTPEGPRVLEFNCRFGDPETQAILPLLKTDLLDLLSSLVAGDLGSRGVEWRTGKCVCVVLASAGYPGPIEKGRRILGLSEGPDEEDVFVFHAGTVRGEDGSFLTDGGRVLGVSGVAPDFGAAAEKAYRAVEKIAFDGMRFRRDIGPRVAEASGPRRDACR